MTFFILKKKAAFKIIKALLPPKAVASLRFVNSKNLSEYIAVENILTCWGGKDDYQFKFEPENFINNNNYGEEFITTDENDNTTVIIPGKKVRVNSKAFLFVLIDFVFNN